MKKIILLLNLLLTISFTAICQHTISGFTSSKNATVPYATVALYPLDSLWLYKASLSDSAGYFQLKDIAAGVYVLKIQNVSFTEYIDTLFLSEKSGASIHLGNIKLTEFITSLEGVEVIAKRPLMERINNLTVMNVELASVFIGSNAFELLRKVPGVVISSNEDISLYYKSVFVTMDSKELNLGGNELATFLKSIPFEEIIKLEINPNPTANFDAEGAGGIINIVTKRRVQNGIHGRVNANTSFSFNEFRTGSGVSASLSAKINKLSFIVRVGVQKQAEYQRSEGVVKLLANNGVFIQKINGSGDHAWDGDANIISPFGRIDLDYAINQKSSISLSFRLNHTFRKVTEQSYNRLFFNSTIPDSSFFSKSEHNARGTFYSTNLNYSYEFKPQGGKISMDLNYSPYRSSKSKINQEDAYFLGDFIGESYRTFSIERDFAPTFSDILYAKVDFSQPFSSKINFSTGIKITSVANNSNSAQYFNGLVDTLFSNSIKYTENIAAAYAFFTYQINDNNSLNIGLRGEYTSSQMNQRTIDSIYLLKAYFNLFPNLNYSIKINDNQNFSISYNYRITRPQYWDLDPKMIVYNEFSVSRGNIDLKPSYTHDANMMHTYKNMFFSFLGYQSTQGMPYKFNYYNDSSLITTTMIENVAKFSAIYAGEQFVYAITNWWNTSTFCNFMILFNDFTYLDKKERSHFFKVGIGSYHTFTFLKNYAAEFSFSWDSDQKLGFSEFKTPLNISIGLRANLLKNDLILSLRVSPLNNIIKVKNKYPNGNESHYTLYQHNDLIFIALSYRFGKESFDKSFKNIEIEELQGRIKMD